MTSPILLLLALVLLSPNVVFASTNLDTLKGSKEQHDVSGSLKQLVPASQTPEGSTFYESTGGVHPYQICHLGMKPPHTSMDGQQFYCRYRQEDDEPITYISLLPFFDSSSSSIGLFETCPDENAKCYAMDISGLTLDSCLASCSDVVTEGEACSERNHCSFGSFCQRIPGNATGFCNECPIQPESCLGENDKFSTESCLQCYPQCVFHSWADVTVDDRSIWAYAPTSFAPAATGEVIAPTVDCSDLALDQVNLCPAANNSICLVNAGRSNDPILTVKIVNKCEKSGGLAALIYNNKLDVSSDDVPRVIVISVPLMIPSAIISYDDGNAITQSKLGSTTNVTVYDAGTKCASSNIYCSKAIPCTNENEFCMFPANARERGIGCFSCPEDPLDCYFKMDIGEGKHSKNVASCSSQCAASIEFGHSCKTCGDTITGFEFGVDDPADRCEFCPKDDMKYPDRIVPFFSVGETKVKCWQVQSFFREIDIDKNTGNCLLSQLQNYICGCEGKGYAGANTFSKQRALVWMPRVSALLSIMGSLFIIVDILCKRGTRRQEIYHQIMLCISVFDIIGSAAYGFTSAPIPVEYYYEGAHGNDATCTAQGFFIQVGTVAAYTNVSLAFYYFLAIRKGLDEAQLRSYRFYFLLCPIILGLAFAFAGLPYYGNMFLWCNNTALWWPDLPIAVAIFVATIVMGILCYDVHKKVQAFKREQQERGEGNGGTLSTKVFWQSFWYLLGFYMTWVPYLALQYSWSAGTAYTRYYFILLAGTAVPLQGAWNFFNYARTRQLRHARELFSSLVSSVSRRQSIRAGNTEQVTAATSSVVPFMATRSLLDNHDDELLTFFSGTSTPNDVVYDPNYWISSNESLPVPPSHFPILISSVSIPGGNALLIAERIKKVLRDRSIVASYDSPGAKADCFTKEKVRFRIRLYRRPGVIDTIIVEVQRVDGFDLVFQTDTLVILSAAEGRDVDSGLTETFVYYADADDGINDTDEEYTPESLGLINDLLFPADGEAKFERTEIALSALTAFVNVNRVGNFLAALMSRDLFHSEQFVRLREFIFYNAFSDANEGVSTSNQNKLIQLQSLEILANASSCLRIRSQDLSLVQSSVRQLLHLVENAELDPRSADLACLILTNTTRNNDSLSTDENSRLKIALTNAKRYGNEFHADLEIHSQECMRLMYGEIV